MFIAKTNSLLLTLTISMYQFNTITSHSTANETINKNDISCVYDSCPMIYVQGSGAEVVNGLYTPHYVDCSAAVNAPGYADDDRALTWVGWTKDRASFVWNWDENFWGRGWGIHSQEGIEASQHLKYYDYYNRYSPYEVLTDKFKRRTQCCAHKGKNPIPTDVDCLHEANTYWEVISTNPSTAFTIKFEGSYTKTETQIVQVEMSLGMQYKGVEVSAGAMASTESSIQSLIKVETEVTCENVCGAEHKMWGQKTHFTNVGSLLPACTYITCVPYNSPEPQCPVEYCGGNSLFDGCQCCISNEWAGANKDKIPLCKRGDDLQNYYNELKL